MNRWLSYLVLLLATFAFGYEPKPGTAQPDSILSAFYRSHADSESNAIQHRDNVFGNLISRTGDTPNNYLYCGEQYDSDLGLYYNRARYLNTDSGRFWTRDLYEGALVEPNTLHGYIYTVSDPVNNHDAGGFVSEHGISGVMARLGIEGTIQRSLNVFTVQLKKRLVQKIACEAGKEAMVQGIYVLLLQNEHLYVGQTGRTVSQRFIEHLRTLEKQGARLVGMLSVTTGIENARAAKFLREILETALIQELRIFEDMGFSISNVIQNPASDPHRLTKWADPVREGVEKVFNLIPMCKETLL